MEYTVVPLLVGLPNKVVLKFLADLSSWEKLEGSTKLGLGLWAFFHFSFEFKLIFMWITSKHKTFIIALSF